MLATEAPKGQFALCSMMYFATLQAPFFMFSYNWTSFLSISLDIARAHGTNQKHFREAFREAFSAAFCEAFRETFREASQRTSKELTKQIGNESKPPQTHTQT